MERRPHVADMRGVSGKIVLAKPRLNELVVLEKLGEKLRMPPGNAIPFTSVGNLRLSKDPRCLKQPIICDPCDRSVDISDFARRLVIALVELA